MNTLVLPVPSSPSPWRRALPALALALGAVLLLYRDTAEAMVLIWSRSATYAHAYLVPPIAAWLIWRQREALAALKPRPAPVMLLPMALAALAWLAGDLASANAVTQLAFTTLLVLAVPAVLGLEVGRRLLFPLGFLFFAVPIGDFTVPMLMRWTADFTVGALRFSGIPVYREGQQFIIPSGAWSVVEACSGVRYLMASLTVGTLFAYLRYRSLKRRLLFSLVALVLPVVANWVRAYFIVLLGHVSDNRLAAGVDHLIYGWVFFGIVMAAMFMVGARWAEPDADLAPARPAAGGAGPAGFPAGMAWTVAAAAAALSVWPHVALWALDRGERAGTPQLRALAPAAGWSLGQAVPADWAPAFHEPAAVLQQSFRRDDAEVGLYVGYYRHQDYGHKLVTPDNMLVRTDDPKWALVESGSAAPGADAAAPQWRTALLRAASLPGQPGARQLVAWQMYWIDGKWTSSDVRARLAGAWQRLLRRGDDAAVVVVHARVDAGDGRAQIDAFVRDHLPRLDEMLRATRDDAR